MIPALLTRMWSFSSSLRNCSPWSSLPVDAARISNTPFPIPGVIMSVAAAVGDNPASFRPLWFSALLRSRTPACKHAGE